MGSGVLRLSDDGVAGRVGLRPRYSQVTSLRNDVLSPPAKGAAKARLGARGQDGDNGLEASRVGTMFDARGSRPANFHADMGLRRPILGAWEFVEDRFRAPRYLREALQGPLGTHPAPQRVPKEPPKAISTRTALPLEPQHDSQPFKRVPKVYPGGLGG